jgi:hypothetical protein
MPTYLFVNQQPNPMAPVRFVVAFPGSMAQVQAYVNQQNMGGSNQRYSVYKINESQPPTLLAVESYRGPQVSAVHVNGGQPVGPPQGQNQNRPGSEVDRTGFQFLPDAALGVGFDPMYGEMRDPTLNDLIIDSGGSVEVKRNDTL